MKIYKFDVDLSDEPASFEAHDFFDFVPMCFSCQGLKHRRRFPASIEYLSGDVADIHMAGITFVGRRPVIEDLAKRFPGIETRPVVMHTGKSVMSYFGGRKKALPYVGSGTCRNVLSSTNTI